jgi:hypothetical protein
MPSAPESGSLVFVPADARTIRRLAAGTALVAAVLCGAWVQGLLAFEAYPALVEEEARTVLPDGKYANAWFWWGFGIVIAVLVVVPFAMWRVGTSGGWRLDRAYGPWRLSKWVLFSLAATLLLTTMASVSMDIGAMRVLGDYWNIDYPALDAAMERRTWAFWLPVAAGLLMFLVDTVAKAVAPCVEGSGALAPAGR